MDCTRAVEDWWKVECDLLILPLFSECSTLEIPDDDLRDLMAELLEKGDWRGDLGDTSVVIHPAGTRTRRLVLLGLGRKAEFRPDRLVRALMVLLRKMNRSLIHRLAVACVREADWGGSVRSLVEGVVLGSFNPGLYRSRDNHPTRVEKLLLCGDASADEDQFQRKSRRAEITAKATNLARELTFQPGNFLNPEQFAGMARQVAEDVGLQCEILDREELEKKGLNALLAVAQGSSCPPRLVLLRHLPDVSDSDSPLALVGKGVTFDSGGISLKPALAMDEMKADKAGACAVLGAMKAIAQLSIPGPVLGVVPLVENMPGGSAQRPGDVVRTLSGKTVEVINTDAEGRLILADAITFALKRFQPACLIDIATLTGACVVALGHQRAGYFSNDDALAALLETSAAGAGEGLWRLPLDPEYRSELDSKIADLKNVGGRWGGAITAAKFLQEFVEDRPWCHIDMAGMDLFQGDELAGPTGFGVRSLVEFADRWFSSA